MADNNNNNNITPNPINPNNLLVPDSSPYFQDAVTGRQRSNSTRSQRSQRSGILTPLAELEAPNTPERDYTRRPSIRIRRLSSVQPPTPGIFASEHNGAEGSPLGVASGSGTSSVRRNRSTSDPQRGVGGVPRLFGTRDTYMPEVQEENISPTTGRATEQFPPIMDQADQVDRVDHAPVHPEPERAQTPTPTPEPTSRWRTLRRARTNIGAEKEKGKEVQSEGQQTEHEYEEDLVDLLDLVDPEVSTLQTLTNVQNSLFVPDLGKFLNRRPTYNLTKRPTQVPESSTSGSDDDVAPDVSPKDDGRPVAHRVNTGATLNTISSHVNDKYYAVLPHGVRIPNWSEEEKLELNDHVRHMLHSRRSKFKRSMKGFKQYVSKPLGFFVTFYAVSITAFGLAWVLFLIGWINVGGSREDYLVNIIDNVLVALFAVMGDGLAPFRCIDTYHMCFIAHYHHLTWRLRREKSLPKLANNSDLPAVQPSEVTDIEKQEFSVLSPEQVKKLQHHQKKFARSHSFYKPHETATHYAFPLRLLVAIVVLLDCHSLLQIALGTCTWAISYHVRPFALTTVILCCSITVNITAGILITVGDHKTRKKDVREKMIRQEMTAEGIKKVEKKRRHELKKAGLVKDGEKKESALDMAGETEEQRSARQSRLALRVVDPGVDAVLPKKL